MLWEALPEGLCSHTGQFKTLQLAPLLEESMCGFESFEVEGCTEPRWPTIHQSLTKL